MSLEKIVQEAMAGRPLEMQEAFQEEIQIRMAEALEEKFVSVMEAKSKDEDEDDDEDDEDEDAPKSKDDDEDEDAPKSKDDDEDEDDDDKPAFLKKKNEEVEEAFDETLEEGPFKGIGKMMMKNKLNRAEKSLRQQHAANDRDKRDKRSAYALSTRTTGSKAAGKAYDAADKRGDDILHQRKRTKAALDRLNKSSDKDVKFPFNKRNEEVEETSNASLEEGPFKGIGKMMMKRKLNKTNDSLDKARTANKNDQRDARFNRASDSVTGLPSDERDARETRLAKQGIDMKAKQKRVQKATDRLNRKPNNDVKFPFNNR
jgi:hypothetical protein